jgi:SNF2 family DNA or RNA helicase
MQRSPKKNGEWSKPIFVKINAARSELFKQQPFQQDADILRQIFGEWGTAYELDFEGHFAAAILPQLLATGRCYWQDANGQPLVLAEPRAAVPVWKEDAAGRQITALEVTPPVTAILPFDPPWFIDQPNFCGPLDVPGPPGFAARWLAAPPVAPEISTALAEVATKRSLPAPKTFQVRNRRGVRPTPILRLTKVTLSRPITIWTQNSDRPEEIRELDIATAWFDYDGTRVLYSDQSDVAIARRDDAIERITRMPRVESNLAADLVASGLKPILSYYNTPPELDDALRMNSPNEWLQWITEDLPELERNGWKVEIDPSFSFRLTPIDDWYSETLKDSSGNDWFSYELGIIVEGERINLLPLLPKILNMIQDADAEKKTPKAFHVQLLDGRMVPVPIDRLRQIAATLAELFDPDALAGGRLQLSKLRAAELIDLNDQVSWKGPDELRDLSAKIRAFNGIAPISPPEGLNATLRPYQLEGLSWLQFLREHNFGGILADDMGLGKTVQALAHVLTEKKAGRAAAPTLGIAPTSLMANLRHEAAKYEHELKVLILHGNDRKESFDQIPTSDLVVTSYALLPRDREIISKHSYHLLILDEAQYIKNPRTQWAETVRSLNSSHRLCMTGTPMENHLGELWSLMHFLSPGYLGSEKQFRRIYRDPIEKAGDKDRRLALARRVRPFIMRRRKEQVALELPEKTEIVRTIDLEGRQRDLYEAIRLAMHQRVQEEVEKKGMSRSHIVILDALLKLRQVCCDPRLVKLDKAKKVRESAKLDLIKEMLPEMISEGRRILLFSQFTSMLDLIEVAVMNLQIPYVRLTGDTTDRETPVKKFQNCEVPLFLISLKAGGTGLNLTAADTVIHYDPWWNPAVERQATDRAHRIGQDKKVFVYKLVTTGTVEEKILAMQERKKELVAGLLGEGAQENLNLSQRDLDHLFEPLA